jgi:SAM-dependent methyltransferase
MLHNSYDRIAAQWHKNFRGQAYVDRTLSYVDCVLEGLPPQANVLDLGCGTGNPIARHIIDRGFHVVGVDQSTKLLEIARTVIPESELIHADMVDLEFTETFAAAIAWDSVFHLPREAHPALYRKLARALDPGRRLLLSVGGSGAESLDSTAGGINSEMFGQSFFYDGYAPDIARQLIETAGFEIELWEVDDPTSHGHIAVIARKT